MKKIIRLTESDLARIVKRVIKEIKNDIDDSVYSDDDPFKGYKDQIIGYLNDNGIDPKSDDDIFDVLSELYYQKDGVATMFLRRLSNR